MLKQYIDCYISFSLSMYGRQFKWNIILKLVCSFVKIGKLCTCNDPTDIETWRVPKLAFFLVKYKLAAQLNKTNNHFQDVMRNKYNLFIF